MQGVPIGSPSRSGYALRLGAMIRPTALRSSLAKPEGEASLPVDLYPASCEGLLLSKDPYHAYTASSFRTSCGGDTKDPYCGYTSSVTSAGGRTNPSPQSEGAARTTGGTRRRLFIDPLWVGLENQHLGSDLPRGEVVMRGVPIGSPSRSGYALRLGAMIRPTALRSSLAKPEGEASLPVDLYPASCEGLLLSKDPYHAYTASSFRTSCGGDTKDLFRRYTSSVTSCGGDTKDPYCGYTSFVTSCGGDTKDPYCRYTSFVTSAGGQTNPSPQSEGAARTTGGARRRPWIDPLWVGLKTEFEYLTI